MQIYLNGKLINIPVDIKDKNNNFYPKEVIEKSIGDYIYRMKMKDRINKIRKIQNGRISKM